MNLPGPIFLVNTTLDPIPKLTVLWCSAGSGFRGQTQPSVLSYTEP